MSSAAILERKLWTVEVRKRLDFTLQVLADQDLPFILKVTGVMQKAKYLDFPHPELFQIRIAKLGMTFSVEYEISDSAELTDIENRFLKQVGVNRNLGSLSITNDGQTVLKTYDGFSEGQTRLLTTEQTVKSYLDMALIRSYTPAESD